MKKYRDEIAEICHEIVEDGYRSGKITDVELKEFEKDCFVSESKTACEYERPLEVAHVATPKFG